MKGLRSAFDLAAACFRAKLSPFAHDRKGVAALEFALLAPLFFFMLFAIFESCITFAAQQVMVNATDDLGREMRTGRIKAEDITPASLHEMFCERLPAFFASGCPGLRIDIRNFETFDEVAEEFAKGIVPTSFQVNLGPALSKNIMRVFYEWPAITTVFSDRVQDPANGKTLLFATQTWQNEPFD